jgi:hypothetical protein
MSTKYVNIMNITSFYFIGVRDVFLRREKRIPRHSSLTCACKQTDLEDDIKKVRVMNRTRCTLHILSLTCACKQTDLEDDIKKVSVMNRTRNVLMFFSSLVAHYLFDVRRRYQKIKYNEYNI